MPNDDEEKDFVVKGTVDCQVEYSVKAKSKKDACIKFFHALQETPWFYDDFDCQVEAEED